MQEKKELHIKLTEILYLCFWGVMLFTKGIGLYDGQALYKLFLAAGLGFICLKMCITSHTLKEWLRVIGISILMGIVYFISKEKGIVICTLTVLAMKDVSVKRVFKVGMYTWGITMCGNIFYHLVNLSASGYKVHEKLGLGHIFRWDLGFSHPNVLHISYLVLCGFMVYNLDKKYNWKYAFALMVGNLFIFLYSISYTGIMVVTLYLGLSLYINMRKSLSKPEYGLLEMVFPVCILLSLLSPILLPEKIFTIANKIFSNRLVLAEYYLIPENIKLFGNNLENITTHILTMDNAYVFSFIIYGVIFFIIIVSSYLLLIRKCVKEEKKRELALITCFLIAGITEPFLFNTSFKNITLVFLGAVLFSEKGKKEEKEWGIFPRWNKEFVLNGAKLSHFMEVISRVWEENKKKILIVSIVAGLAAGIVYGTKKQMPAGYIVPRIHVDIESDETWYIENTAEYTDFQFLDYKDAETKMQILQGNIVTVEYVRGIVAAFSIALITIGGISLVCMGIKDKKINLRNDVSNRWLRRGGAEKKNV